MMSCAVFSRVVYSRCKLSFFQTTPSIVRYHTRNLQHTGKVLNLQLKNSSYISRNYTVTGSHYLSSDKPPDRRLDKPPDKRLDKPPDEQCLNSTDEGKPEIIKSIQIQMPKTKREKRRKIDMSQLYYQNSYVTPVRAMNEFMLTSSDLENLPKYTRRSPYQEGGEVTVYLRADVLKQCYEVWNGPENYQKAKTKREEAEKQRNITQFFLKQTLKEVRKESKLALATGGSPGPQQIPAEDVWKSGSGRVVLYAIAINTVNFALKTVAWLYSGSHSMFSEAIHSLADTCNQVILAVGISKSIQKPDIEHPYGYSNMRYVASLISGVGIFCLGAGLSWYHGIQALMHSQSTDSLQWAIAILGGSLISEGSTLWMAVNQARKSAANEGISVWNYIRNGYEPAVNVVLLEDTAAVLGVSIAATCMGISHYTANPFADAVGSIMIGCLLGGVAVFIIHTNTQALVGRSIQPYKIRRISDLLESDRLVRAIHDVKATDMGAGLVRFKAEVDFDGQELTRIYLENNDLDTLLNEMQKVESIEEMEKYMMQYGAKVIDLLGEEVDRLEKKIMIKFPEVRHVDLEVL